MTTDLIRKPGPAYVSYTGDPDHDVIREAFIERFGVEPETIFVEGGLTKVGPAPEIELNFEDDGVENED